MLQMQRNAAACLAMLAALFVGGVLASTTLGAEPAEPLPITSASPANGATLQPIGQPALHPLQLEVISPVTTAGRYWMVKIATQNIPGQNGSLANDFKVEGVSLEQSDAYPTVYRGQAFETWLSTPGMYYWQIEATEIRGAPTYALVHYLSPVYTLIIAAPPSPPPIENTPPRSVTPTLTLAESYAAVKEIIRERTGHNARHLSDKCHRQSQNKALCKAQWATAVHFSSGTFLYSGTFGLVAEPEENHFLFLGLRARWGCLRRFGERHCASKVSWHS
jgi:hypothetical protein